MDKELVRVPAQVLLDAGVTKSARLCLAIMYLRVDETGFCGFTALGIAALMGTTDTAIRRHWDGLVEAGYIEPSTRPAKRRKRQPIRGHNVALKQDGPAFEWAEGRKIGSEYMDDEGAAQ